MERIKFIDGFRGLAILLVIFFHAFTKWTELVPYGNIYSDFVVFHYGWLGVQLFFLISGFVILMTLEKCVSFKEFIVRRWLRLFPAMLIVSVIILLTARFLPERPRGIPSFIDIIPGLLFLEPTWISRLLHLNQGILEGTFWSLFVEFKYYIIFGLLYFILGKWKSVGAIFLLFLVAFIANTLAGFVDFPFIIFIKNGFFQLSFLHFGWFATGSLMYLWFKENNSRILYMAIFVGLLSVLSLDNGSFLPALSILIVFVIAVVIKVVRKFFDNKFFVYLGFISYPLYLMHENALIALIIKIHRYADFIPAYLLPVVPILGMILLSDVIARYAEPLLKNILKFLLFKTRIVNKLN